jgi:uracil-DNA glycosylase
MSFASPVLERFYVRLRRAPTEFSAPATLPVLFFGNIANARIATIALNPGTDWRCLETLTSLRADDRRSLTDQQCDRAILAMRRYFHCLGNGLPDWWRSLDKVTRHIGFAYGKDKVAHLDLVQESTEPKWGKLEDGPKDLLLRLDLPFLAWELETFALRVLVCNGKTTLDEVLNLVGEPRPFHRGPLGGRTWYAGVAKFRNRCVGITGWNIPLHQRPGLRNEDAKALGQVLAERLRNYGILEP